MTARPLTFDFPMMSELAERPPHAIPQDEILLGAEEELDHRRAAYPDLVRNRRLRPDDADRHLGIWHWIVEDLRALGDIDRTPPAQRFPWRDGVREIRRELALRRNMIGQQLAQKRLTGHEARLRLERIDGLHWMWWFEFSTIDRTSEWEGVDWRVAHDVIRGMNAQRDEWLAIASASGDRAACAFIGTYQAEWIEALQLGRRNRLAQMARLTELRPDLPSPTWPTEQAA